MTDTFKPPLEIQIRTKLPYIKTCNYCDDISTHFMNKNGNPTWVCCKCRITRNWSEYFDVCRPNDVCLH